MVTLVSYKKSLLRIPTKFADPFFRPRLSIREILYRPCKNKKKFVITVFLFFVLFVTLTHVYTHNAMRSKRKKVFTIAPRVKIPTLKTYSGNQIKGRMCRECSMDHSRPLLSDSQWNYALSLTSTVLQKWFLRLDATSRNSVIGKWEHSGLFLCKSLTLRTNDGRWSSWYVCIGFLESTWPKR